MLPEKELPESKAKQKPLAKLCQTGAKKPCRDSNQEKHRGESQNEQLSETPCSDPPVVLKCRKASKKGQHKSKRHSEKNPAPEMFACSSVQLEVNSLKLKIRTRPNLHSVLENSENKAPPTKDSLKQKKGKKRLKKAKKTSKDPGAKTSKEQENLPCEDLFCILPKKKQSSTGPSTQSSQVTQQLANPDPGPSSSSGDAPISRSERRIENLQRVMRQVRSDSV